MIVRFVDRALRSEGPEETSSPGEAGELVIKVYEIDPRGAASLNAFEHAIWRVESARKPNKGGDEKPS